VLFRSLFITLSRSAFIMTKTIDERASFLKDAAIEATRGNNHFEEVQHHTGTLAFKEDEFHKRDPDDWMHTTARNNYTAAELAIAKRCHGAHIETAINDITPIGSHYLLVHFDVPTLPSTHTMKIHGLVKNELTLDLETLKTKYACETHPVVLECAGDGRGALHDRLWVHVPWGQDAFGCSEWTGVRLCDILNEASLCDGAKQVVFTGADRGIQGNEVQYYQRSLSIDDAMLKTVMVAFVMNGTDIPASQGYPFRLVVSGWYGMASVKWLTSIEVTDGNWWGYQMESYSFARSHDDKKKVPMREMLPRSVMVPPGYPDFFSRTRIIEPGLHKVIGKAWAGAIDLKYVEFSSDYGNTWKECILYPKNGAFGWASWEVLWDATVEGTYILLSRCVDKMNHEQNTLTDTQFNYGSFACTQPQCIYIKVDQKISTPGAIIDLTPEINAARTHDASSVSSTDPIDALYRVAGHQ